VFLHCWLPAVAVAAVAEVPQIINQEPTGCYAIIVLLIRAMTI
jgi:hypothetical protein